MYIHIISLVIHIRLYTSMMIFPTYYERSSFRVTSFLFEITKVVCCSIQLFLSTPISNKFAVRDSWAKRINEQISLPSRPNLLRNTHFVALKGLFKRSHFYIKKKITRSKQGKTFLQRLISVKVWIRSKYLLQTNTVNCTMQRTYSCPLLHLTELSGCYVSYKYKL